MLAGAPPATAFDLRSTPASTVAPHRRGGKPYNALLDAVEQQWPMTVRQVFYQAEVHGLVEKAETGYMKVQRALMALRKNKRLPFRRIVDNTR